MIRKDIKSKKRFLAGTARILNHLNPPPLPMTPIRVVWSSFWMSNFNISICGMYQHPCCSTVGPNCCNIGLQQLASEIPHRPALLLRKFSLIVSIVCDSPYLQLHFLKKGPTNSGIISWTMPKRKLFFLLMSSLSLRLRSMNIKADKS